MSGALLTILCILASAFASYCLKLGATSGATGRIVDLVVNPMVIAGAFFYAISFGAYAFALQKVPLSLAQPAITAGVSIVTAMVSVMLFDETMSLANWCGLMLVCVGIILLSAGKI